MQVIQVNSFLWLIQAKKKWLKVLHILSLTPSCMAHHWACVQLLFQWTVRRRQSPQQSHVLSVIYKQPLCVKEYSLHQSLCDQSWPPTTAQINDKGLLKSLMKVFNQLPPLSSCTNLTNRLNTTWPSKNGWCWQSQQWLFYPVVEAVRVAKNQQNGRKHTHSEVNEQDRSIRRECWVNLN